LGHNQLNVLIFKTFSIDFLSIIFVVLLLSISAVDGLALAMIVGVIVASVVVTGVVVRVSSCQLLSGRGLSLRVEVLNLGFTENTFVAVSGNLLDMVAKYKHVGVAGGRLVNFWLVDNKEDLKKYQHRVPVP
jgi:hypothetical protein